MCNVEKDRRWIVARDKQGLLTAMMHALAGNAHISFEGDLSRCTFPSDLTPVTEETPSLVRNTMDPRQDFVVLPLEEQTIRPILEVVLPKKRFTKNILHIQIEKNGRVKFGSHDNFHSECIVAFRGVPAELLIDLKEHGVIRPWTEPH